MMVPLLSPLLLPALLGLYPAELPSPVTSLLLHGRFVATKPEFRIIALSNVADACAGVASSSPREARACLERTYELALATRPKGLDLLHPDSNHGLWLSHLALVLGAADRTGKCLDAGLHERIAVELMRRSLSEPLAHVPSYPGVRARWPADQSATLASLHRYDVAHGGMLSTEPARRYFTVVERSASKDGLPRSEVAQVTDSGRYPRGCALSFSVRYLAEVDLPRARALWQRYVAGYLVDGVLVTGFREWPKGVERGEDADSGPVVSGIGAAASAFGISAARAMGDERLAQRLESVADRVTWLGGKVSTSIERAAASTLAAAVRASARQQKPLVR
ncbi:MAG: hypothetical protein JNM83_02815 [Myxococcales bacterium]|jgi:hypothetical protein|nr:hypothetical protein [Myxococcales bacterium]